MTGTAILTEIVSILVGGIEGVASGIGSGLSTLATSIFLQTTGTGSDAVTSLSTFGILIVVFAGVSLAQPTIGEVKSGKIGGGLYGDNTEVNLMIA